MSISGLNNTVASDLPLHIGVPTQSLEDCYDGCVECRESWYGDNYEDQMPHCVDDTPMKYKEKCPEKNKWQSDKCNDEGLCVKTWPSNDPKAQNSHKAICRTLPDKFLDGNFKFSKKQAKKNNMGLCSFGCADEEVCRWSYLRSDPEKGRGSSAMFRCAPN